MVNVYLDTDCVLALVKDSDRLKEPVQNRIKDEKGLLTSVLTVVECRLVLLRENTPEEMFRIEKTLKDWKIKLIPLDEKVLKKSKQLMHKHDFLGTFDALHIATAINQNEKTLSTDHIFAIIPGLNVIDPRD